LSLYILTSNFIGIIETRRVRRHLEAEAKQPPKPKKSASGWWGKIQKRIEQVAKDYEQDQSRKAKGKK
jgi:membrane protein insertase Oxa1/YidC/SpoIIIJ